MTQNTLSVAVGGVLVSIEEMQLVRVLILGNLNRILARKARIAKSLAPFLERVKAIPAQVRERIGGDVAADFLDRMARREQLLFGRRVDAVKA